MHGTWEWQSICSSGEDLTSILDLHFCQEMSSGLLFAEVNPLPTPVGRRNVCSNACIVCSVRKPSSRRRSPSGSTRAPLAHSFRNGSTGMLFGRSSNLLSVTKPKSYYVLLIIYYFSV